MNASILTKSFSYLTDNFRNLSSISSWSHQQLIEAQYRRSKLKYALQRRDLEVIERLISKNEDPCELDQYLVVYPKHREMIKLLILNGAYVDDGEDSLLLKACIEKDYDLFKFIIDKRVVINTSRLMNWLAKYDDSKIIELFNENGTKLTPSMLKVALRHNNYDVIDYLISKNVSIEDDCYCNVCLFEAWKREKINIVRKLLEVGHEIPIMSAEERYKNLDIFKLYIQYTDGSHEHLDLMQRCIEENRLDIILIVFKNINKSIVNFCVPLCAKYNNINMLKFFLSRHSINKFCRKSAIKNSRENNNQEMINFLRKNKNEFCNLRL